MTLVDDGRLDLDRPLDDYLTDPYLASDRRAGSITARMVLSHTTGFPNWRGDRALFLRWSPGTRWGYSGEGYAYLQQIVERLTGARLHEYLADAVRQPLGLCDSTFAYQNVDENRLARGHSIDGNLWPAYREPQAKAAAGGMFTTVSDYLRFLIHTLADDHCMFDPQARIDDELAWGLGWGIERTDVGAFVWQWGDDPGYKNFVIGSPADRRGVVVFTNGDNGPEVYSEVVRHLLYREHIPPSMCGTGLRGSTPGWRPQPAPESRKDCSATRPSHTTGARPGLSRTRLRRLCRPFMTGLPSEGLASSRRVEGAWSAEGQPVAPDDVDRRSTVDRVGDIVKMDKRIELCLVPRHAGEEFVRQDHDRAQHDRRDTSATAPRVAHLLGETLGKPVRASGQQRERIIDRETIWDSFTFSEPKT